MIAPAVHWQLGRLSTAARDTAAQASVRAGVSLSSWLSKLICDTCAAEGVAPPAEPRRILGFTQESDGRIPLAEPSVFRATTMVVAPVSAYRPLRVLQTPVQVPEGKS